MSFGTTLVTEVRLKQSQMLCFLSDFMKHTADAESQQSRIDFLKKKCSTRKKKGEKEIVKTIYKNKPYKVKPTKSKI